jgi:hypothetical protein
MICRWLGTALLMVPLVVMLPAGLAAQDPTKTIPGSYTVAFENGHVRVVRVRYDAGAKLPEHTHPAGTTVYVYLTDSEGVAFKHVGGSNSTVTRPAVKAGGMRVATGREEHHTVENNSALPSDFLRIYFKTEADGSRNLRQRLSPADEKYENAQMRITRLKVAPHQTLTVEAKAAALLIELPSGQERWVDAGTSEPVSNHDARDLSLIRIDFLTRPKK